MALPMATLAQADNSAHNAISEEQIFESFGCKSIPIAIQFAVAFFSLFGVDCQTCQKKKPDHENAFKE